MDITMTIQRTKRGDEIWETFMLAPQHSILLDESRAIYHRLRTLRGEYSLHREGWRLLQIIYGQYQCQYIYAYDKTMLAPQTMKVVTLKYFPVLGKRTCQKCLHPQMGFCTMKGKRIEKYSYYKCRYWAEREDAGVFKQRPTSRNGGTNGTVPGHDKLRRKPHSKIKQDNG